VALEAAQVRAGPPRPSVRRKKDVVSEQARATLAAGGEVWCGDETALREFPPLRAAWAKRGEQATVVISGRNSRRVLHGFINVHSGEVVTVTRERNRGADSEAAITALGAVRPGVPKLLVWDNAPPHHTKLVRAAAEAGGSAVAWLPFRSPELNPCEDLWRHLKATVAANRAYPTVDALADRATAWVADQAGSAVRRLAGLNASKFEWLTT
jgi:transposase